MSNCTKSCPKAREIWNFIFYKYRNNIFKHNQIISITDGAPWIKNMISDLFPNAIHILDLYHVKERVYKFAKVHINDETQKSKWVNEVNGLIENGKIDDALSKIEPYQDNNNDDDTNLYNYSKRILFLHNGIKIMLLQVQNKST